MIKCVCPRDERIWVFEAGWKGESWRVGRWWNTWNKVGPGIGSRDLLSSMGKAELKEG